MTDDGWRAVLVGGPADGREIEGLRADTDIYELTVVGDGPVAGVGMLIAVYRLVLADDGHPSVDDAGRRRLRFGGTR